MQKHLSPVTISNVRVRLPEKAYFLYLPALIELTNETIMKNLDRFATIDCLRFIGRVSLSLVLGLFFSLFSRIPISVVAQGQQSSDSNSGSVPAIYYGPILTSTVVPNFVPAAGMSVEAFINETSCGQSQTQTNEDGGIVYQIQVLSDSAVDGKRGCGALGLTVNLFVNSTPMAPSAMWDNTTQHELPLSPATLTPTLTPTATATSIATVTPTPTLILPPGTPIPIPEPVTGLLFGIGAAGLFVVGLLSKNRNCQS